MRSVMGKRAVTFLGSGYIVLGLAVVAVAQSPQAVRSGNASTSASDTRLARIMNGRPPADLAELKALQQRIRELTPQILPATVAIQVGRANGSGVIIDESGHVLTAAHVAGHPGRLARIHLPSGREVQGTTLGLNQELDAGLIRIDSPGPWPHVGLGTSAGLRDGQWVLATGHPGGFDRERPPVLRWGRVLKSENTAILTDCTLVGGDSGGPLFNLNGEVVGIHSRIGKNLTINVHVPIDPFRQSWDRLARGEVWGLLAPGSGWLGVVEDRNASRARVLRLAEGSPAQAAGLQAGDIIVRVGDQPIANFGELQQHIRQHRPGSTIEVEVDRGGAIHQFQVSLGSRPD